MHKNFQNAATQTVLRRYFARKYANAPFRCATAVVFTALNMIVLPKLVNFWSFGLFAVDGVIIAVYHVHYQKHLSKNAE